MVDYEIVAEIHASVSMTLTASPTDTTCTRRRGSSRSSGIDFKEDSRPYFFDDLPSGQGSLRRTGRPIRSTFLCTSSRYGSHIFMCPKVTRSTAKTVPRSVLKQDKYWTAGRLRSHRCVMAASIKPPSGEGDFGKRSSFYFGSRPEPSFESMKERS